MLSLLNRCASSYDPRIIHSYYSLGSSSTSQYHCLMEEAECDDADGRVACTYKGCDVTFRNMSELQRHIRVHTGERPFKCENCTKAFARRACLTRHKAVHAKDTPFKCKHCNKGFTFKFARTRHERLHSQASFPSSPADSLGNGDVDAATAKSRKGEGKAPRRRTSSASSAKNSGGSSSGSSSSSSSPSMKKMMPGRTQQSRLLHGGFPVAYHLMGREQQLALQAATINGMATGASQPGTHAGPGVGGMMDHPAAGAAGGMIDAVAAARRLSASLSASVSTAFTHSISAQSSNSNSNSNSNSSSNSMAGSPPGSPVGLFPMGTPFIVPTADGQWMMASQDMVQSAYQAAMVGQQQQQQQSTARLPNWLPQSSVTAANSSAPVPQTMLAQAQAQATQAVATAATTTAAAVGAKLKETKVSKAKQKVKAGKTRAPASTTAAAAAAAAFVSGSGSSAAAAAAAAAAGGARVKLELGSESVGNSCSHPFSCKDCSRTFQFKSYLDKHLLIHMVLDSVSDEEEAERDAAAAKQASARRSENVSLPPMSLAANSKQCSTEAPGGINGKVRMMNSSSFSSVIGPVRANGGTAGSSGCTSTLDLTAAEAEIQLRLASMQRSAPPVARTVPTAILAAS